MISATGRVAYPGCAATQKRERFAQFGETFQKVIDLFTFVLAGHHEPDARPAKRHRRIARMRCDDTTMPQQPRDFGRLDFIPDQGRYDMRFAAEGFIANRLDLAAEALAPGSSATTALVRDNAGTLFASPGDRPADGAAGTAADPDAAEADAAALAQRILEVEPLASYAHRVNLYRVDTPSDESGVSYDCDTCAFRDTAFGSVFAVELVNRLLGTEGTLGEMIGLDAEWAKRAIAVAGRGTAGVAGHHRWRCAGCHHAAAGHLDRRRSRCSVAPARQSADRGVGRIG